MSFYSSQVFDPVPTPKFISRSMMWENTMLKMGLIFCFCFCFLCFLGLTGAGQESLEYLELYETTPEVVHALSWSDLPIAVPVKGNVLKEVSSSVLKAESWLRLHVLAHFPAIKITTILVGDTILCQKDQVNDFDHLLPSLKNLYHSLKRWGLEKDIKVSAAFSSSCLHQNSALFSDDFAKLISPVLEFLQDTNSTYSISFPNLSSYLHESLTVLSSHLMKKFGSFKLTKVNLIVSSQQEKKPMSRRLSVVDSEQVKPYPASPTPFPEISPPSTFQSSIGFSVPANVAKKPHPPRYPTISPPPVSFPGDSPPPFSFPIAPERAPPMVPASSPNGFYLPPCNPDGNIAPAPTIGVVQKLWCVAKPSVPAETLQQAMDYACGEGGADCEEIMPQGSCFYPDTVVAHASYAFNSYWQKTKRNGGTCDFGGTAMIINADPSFLDCRFVLS